MQILIHPGALSPLLILDEVLRERHEDLRAERARTIAKRKADGAPLDDETKWSNLDTLAVQNAIAAHDTTGVIAACNELIAATAGHKLEPLDEYQSVEAYREVRIQFRALKDAERSKLANAVAASGGALADVQAFLIASVAVLEAGDERFAVIDDALVDALEASGMLLDVYVAARDYQRLSVGKGGRFGSRQPQT